MCSASYEYSPHTHGQHICATIRDHLAVSYIRRRSPLCRSFGHFLHAFPSTRVLLSHCSINHLFFDLLPLFSCTYILVLTILPRQVSFLLITRPHHSFVGFPRALYSNYLVSYPVKLSSLYVLTSLFQVLPNFRLVPSPSKFSMPPRSTSSLIYHVVILSFIWHPRGAIAEAIRCSLSKYTSYQTFMGFL